MIILTLHILLGLASIVLGILALIKVNSRILKVQIAAFAGTITTGVGLVIVNPSSLLHLCITGIVFSAITVGIALMTRRQLTLAYQTTN